MSANCHTTWNSEFSIETSTFFRLRKTENEKKKKRQRKRERDGEEEEEEGLAKRKRLIERDSIRSVPVSCSNASPPSCYHMVPR